MENVSSSSSSKDKDVSRRRQRMSASKGIDYFSRLPEVILLHILSFLSLKNAIVVSLVSRRWKYLWTKLSSLNLDEFVFIKAMTKRSTSHLFRGNIFTRFDSVQRPHHLLYEARRKFADLVDQLVMHHLGCTINHFRLSFHYSPCEGYRRMDSWVKFAMRTDINKLELNFCDNELYVYNNSFQPYDWPHDCYASKFVKSMILTYCEFGTAATIGIFSALQKLSLNHSAVLDFTIGDLASKCPALEDLNLQNCYVHGNFFVSEDDIMMRTLKLLNCQPCEGSNSKLCINMSTPYLSKLIIVAGHLATLSIRNAIHLVDASIEVNKIFTGHVTGDALGSLLHDLNHCKTLKLSTQCIQVPYGEESMPRQIPLPFQNLKNLILVVGFPEQEYPRISCLLKDSLNLESLTLELVAPLSLRWGVFEGEISDTFNFDEPNYWELNTLPCSCLQNCLKKIDVKGFAGRRIEVQLLHFLLNNARVLEKMVISTLTRYQVDGKILQELLNLPKASPQATVEIFTFSNLIII